MAVVLLCGVLVIVGAVVALRWGGEEFRAPALPATDAPAPSAGDVIRRYVWSVAVAIAAGAGAGLLVAGPGGRLAMRLLAATAGDAAQGRVTEAEEVVGRITVGGSIGFVIFVGLFGGVLSGALYLLVRRWLPAGRGSGVAFGALLLAIGATRVDPLRAGNEDFDIVGPGWLAVLVFGGLVMLHAMAVAAVAARYSRSLEARPRTRRQWAGYLPLVVLLPGVAVAGFVAAGGLLLVAVNRLTPAVVSWLRSPAALRAGRVVVTGIFLIALPSALATFATIAGKSP